MPASSSGLGLRLLWSPLGFSLNKYVCYMHIYLPWNFHQNVLTLTISFIDLNASIWFVLIYRPHPVVPLHLCIPIESYLFFQHSEGVKGNCSRFLHWKPSLAKLLALKYLTTCFIFLARITGSSEFVLNMYAFNLHTVRDTYIITKPNQITPNFLRIG